MSTSPHSFTVSEGFDELSLEFCGNSCYLRFIHPVAIGFDNQLDSFHEFDLTPHYKGFREEINELISDKLNQCFKGDETEFLKLLDPILAKFHNGQYYLTLNAEEQVGLTIRTEDCDSNLDLLELVFGKTIDKSQTEKVEKLTDTFGIFDQGDDYCYRDMAPIFATKTADEMNRDTVRYFEDSIRKKERPVILLLEASCEHKYQLSGYFLLDGHHKFKAYQNLKTVPNVVIISRVFNATDMRFLPDPLIDCLTPWLSKYVFETSFFNPESITWMLEHPESQVHAFVKNGLVRTYYDNGQLHHEAHYNFNKPNGLSRYWYSNGTLEIENNFIEGERKGKQRRYYESGKLWEEITIDEPEDGMHSKLVWYEGGARKMEANFHKHMYSHIIPIRTWFENGQMEREITGTDMTNCESREWNDRGELLEHFTRVNGVIKHLK